MKKLLFSAAALAALFTACKDDDTTPTPQATKLLLNIVSEYDSISLTYNANNKIARFESVALAGENAAYYSEAVYENGKMTKLLASDESPTALVLAQTYDYNATGSLLRINFFSANGQRDQYDSVAYDNNGRVAALYLSEHADGGTTQSAFYEKCLFVWDGKGNVAKQHVIKITDGKETTDTVTTAFTYDDKVNFAAKQFELHLLEPESVAFALSANNILTEKTEYSDYTETDTNEYTYDEDNYPVTQKNTSQSIQNGQVVYTRVANNKIRYIKK